MEIVKKKRYSIIACMLSVSILISGIIAVYRKHKSVQLELEKKYVALIDDSVLQASQLNGDISLWNMQIQSQADITNQYLKSIFAPIVSILVACIVSEIILFAIFFLFIKQKRKQKMISQITRFSLEKEEIQDEDDLANTMYHCMKTNIDSQIMQYNSMNSYLAHEQKNLLGILYSKYSREGDSQSIAILNKVNESIEDFLTLSDFSKDNAELTDVCMIAAEVCDAYMAIYPDIEFLFEEEGSYNIIARHRWIYRAISNLVDNAVKYGDNKKIIVSLENKHNSILIKVTDYGIGIEEEYQEKIWSNRFQESSMRKDGYGIGLSLVAHVCDLCDGYCYVKSRKGEGSTFILSFPEAE